MNNIKERIKAHQAATDKLGRLLYDISVNPSRYEESTKALAIGKAALYASIGNQLLIELERQQKLDEDLFNEMADRLKKVTMGAVVETINSDRAQIESFGRSMSRAYTWKDGELIKCIDDECCRRLENVIVGGRLK